VTAPAPAVRAAPTAEVLGPLPCPERLLTNAERSRLAGLGRPASRADFLAAHVLVRQCVADLTGGDPADVVVVQRCRSCGGPHGRPRVARAYVSLSHSDGLVAAVAAAVPVGVDVQRLPWRFASGGADARLLAASCTPRESGVVQRSATPAVDFVHAWAGKESLVKVGAFALDAAAGVDLLRPGGAERSARCGRWWVRSWAPGAGPAGAVVDAVVAVAWLSPAASPGRAVPWGRVRP